MSLEEYWQKMMSYIKRARINEENHTTISRFLFRPVDRDVFVRDLNRQLGTPSHWLPVDSCKKENKEAP